MLNYTQEQPRRKKRQSLVNKKFQSDRRTYARSQIPQRKPNIKNVIHKVQNNQILTQEEKRNLSIFVGSQVQTIPQPQPQYMYQQQNHDKDIFYYQIVDFFSLNNNDSPQWVLEYIKKMFLQQQAQIQNLKQNLKLQQEEMYKMKASFKSDRNKLQVQLNRLQKQNQNSIIVNQERDEKINKKWENILQKQIEQNHRATLQMQIATAENQHTTLIYDYLFKNIISYLESKGLWNQNFNMSNFQYTIQNLNDLEMYSNLSTSQYNDENTENPEKNRIEKICTNLKENQQNFLQMQSEIKVGRIKLKNLEIKLNSSADQNQSMYLGVLEQRNQLKEKIVILENNQKVIEQKIQQDLAFLNQKQEDSKYQFKEVELNLQQFYIQHKQQIKNRQKQIFVFLESNKAEFKDNDYLSFLKKALKLLQVEKSLNSFRQQEKQNQQFGSLQSYNSNYHESQTNDQLTLMAQLNQLKMENCQLQQQLQQQKQETNYSNLTSQFLRVNNSPNDQRMTSRSKNCNFVVKNIFSWLLSEKEDEEEDDLKSFSMYQQPMESGFKYQSSKQKLVRRSGQMSSRKQNCFKKKQSNFNISKIFKLIKKIENFNTKVYYMLEGKVQQICDRFMFLKNLAFQKNDYIKKQTVLVNDQFQKNCELKAEMKKKQNCLDLLQIKNINDKQNLQRIQHMLKVGDLVLQKTVTHDIFQEVQNVFQFYQLRKNKAFENCENIQECEQKLNEIHREVTAQLNKDPSNGKQHLSKANTNEELNSILEKHLDLQIQSYQDINSTQNVFDQNNDVSQENYENLKKEYNKIMRENNDLQNRFLEFQEEIFNLNQKIQEQTNEIENVQKNKSSETKVQNQKKINELRKNLKNVRKKMETRNFIIQALKLKPDEEKLKEKVHDILKQLDPNQKIVDFNVFKNTKKQQIFQSIREELSDINFDYFSKAEKSSQESFNESYNHTQYKRKKTNKMQDLERAKSENNKVVLKSRFITTFAPKKSQNKQKKERDFESMFEDAFKDL